MHGLFWIEIAKFIAKKPNALSQKSNRGPEWRSLVCVEWSLAANFRAQSSARTISGSGSCKNMNFSGLNSSREVDASVPYLKI